MCIVLGKHQRARCAVGHDAHTSLLPFIVQILASELNISQLHIGLHACNSHLPAPAHQQVLDPTISCVAQSCISCWCVWLLDCLGMTLHTRLDC